MRVRCKPAVMAIVGVVVGSLLTLARVEAQTMPPRPRMMLGADTNDASAYYRHGISILRVNPRDAANAFHWAVRLDPAYADAFYARRVAMLLQNRQTLAGYLEDNRSIIRSRRVASADSLFRYALLLSPFLFRELDRLLLDTYIEHLAQASDVLEARYYMEDYLRRADPEMRGWLAYTERDFQRAVALYESVLGRSRNKASDNAELARVYFLMNDFDAAERAMTAALTELRRTDEKNLVFLYDSKAMYEYALGRILEAGGKPDAALEAYGRALVEDLSFFPAHGRTARIALWRGDTTAALSSLALAVEIEATDAGTRLEYSRLLVERRAADRALLQLEGLIQAEPWFASPYAVIGQAFEQLGRTADALEAYTQFLARSKATDPERRLVTARVQALRSATVPIGAP